MSPVTSLLAFGLRQVVGEWTEGAVESIANRLTDHSQKLPKALAHANDRAWQSLAMALAGDGLLNQVKKWLAPGDERAFADQVRLFLQSTPFQFDTVHADFRQECLADLKTARQAGLLSAHYLSCPEIAKHTATFQRYADPKSMIDGAENVVARIADDLAEFLYLRKLLRQPTPGGGPPLLVAAFAYFFRREVETDTELAHGLFFDGLRQLSASQAQALAEVGKALTTMGQQFDQVFEQLDRIETVVVETHGVLLDMQVELQRFGSLPDEVRRLMQEVLHRVSQAGMQKGEVKPQDSFSIRSEDERTAVKQLLARFRQLPVQQQHQVPALLNGLGKLQFGSGDFDGARATFETVSNNITDATAQAEAQFNAYRAALEAKKWDEALAAIQKAASLDSQRFAPFPMQRYQPKQLLGAGGFGAAFLCHDRNFDEEVVVKTLHDAAMERNMAEVFQEARLLRKLNHSAIIGVHECEYADPLKYVRPYIVMDYFPGGSLENLIQQSGTLSPDDLLGVARQIAHGMKAAHQQNILHRDLKPDNILVRKDGESWQVKIIDFGLALRKQAIETSMAARSAGNTILCDSVAGTIKYAPPEQIGEMKGVRAGPYSDVYAFGKMCCYALFETTEPRRRQWSSIPDELAEMLETCIEQKLEHRLQSFEPVLQVLQLLETPPSQDRIIMIESVLRRRLPGEVRAGFKSVDEARLRVKQEKTHRGEEAHRQRQELERLHRDGETKLTELVREALHRTQGKPTQDDTAAAKEICKQYRISKQKAKEIVDDVRARWQKAHSPKSERKPGDIITNSLGVKFAWIPAGTFVMGSPPDEEGRGPYKVADETQHTVTLTKGFYLGIHPMTRGQFATFIEQSGHKTQAEQEGGAYFWTGEAVKLDPARNWRTPGFDQTDDHPVVCVSWNDSVAFANWLSERENKPYRLPTEAEWEYACRAGTPTPFYFGETISIDQANYDGNYPYGKGKKGVNRKKTTPAGSFPPNAWGLHDMHGNVWEWCADWYGEYPKSEAVDPHGPGNGDSRVLRGGSFGNRESSVRSACRFDNVPSFRVSNFGIRLARTFTP